MVIIKDVRTIGEGSSLRAKAMASVDGKSTGSYHVRALYSYLSSGEHQLSFHEGDAIVLIGERNKGWQYGENLRNHRVGWFPIAYTEPILDSSESEEQSSGSPERSQWGENSRMYPSISGSPFSKTPRRPSSSYTLSSHALPPDAPTNHSSARPHSTFTDSPLFSAKEIGPKAPPIKAKQTPRTPLHDANHQSTAATPGSTTTTYASIKFHHPPLQELQETPQIFRSPRRSLTAPFPISVPPPNPPSLHSSNDSGFCNEASPTPFLQTEGATVEEGASATEKESRDNIFAGVKLRKVVTNDRSAPMIS
ncbi:SH3 domain-containing protein [Trichonephila clavipes]|nr:SH3 domain-containing protein [Trichonephila clavipes]